MSESKLFSRCSGIPAIGRSVLVDSFGVPIGGLASTVVGMAGDMWLVGMEGDQGEGSVLILRSELVWGWV